MNTHRTAARGPFDSWRRAWFGRLSATRRAGMVGADIPAHVDAVAAPARALEKSQGRRFPSPASPSPLFSVPSDPGPDREIPRDGSLDGWEETKEGAAV